MYNNYKKQEYSMRFSMMYTFQSYNKHSFYSTLHFFSLGFAKQNEVVLQGQLFWYHDLAGI